jgi:hypothetical protein
MNNLPTIQPIQSLLSDIISEVDMVRVGVEIEQKGIEEYIEVLGRAKKELFTLLMRKDIIEVEKTAIQALATQFHLLHRRHKIETAKIAKKPKRTFWKMGLFAVTVGLSYFIIGV